MRRLNTIIVIGAITSTAIGIVLLTPRPLVETDRLSIDKVDLALINQTRKSHGISLLDRSSKLDTSSKNKCEDMVKYNYWSHDREGKLWSEFIDNGYSVAGEILARDFGGDKQRQHDGWLSSRSHYEQIVGNYTEFGSATCRYNDGKDLTVVHFTIK